MPLRPSLIAVFAAVFACPLAAQATKTGGAATQGTLLFMEAGDVACDLTLQALLNKRVRLTYAPARVLADECKGNPDCRKSKTVMLVVVARPVSAVETLCIGAESIVFNCPAGDKVVSVCSSRNASSAAGYLQYPLRQARRRTARDDAAGDRGAGGARRAARWCYSRVAAAFCCASPNRPSLRRV
jgi:hypothetical protein